MEYRTTLPKSEHFCTLYSDIYLRSLIEDVISKAIHGMVILRCWKCIHWLNRRYTLSCSRSECYYEEPYAGKPHVRFCEGLVSWGISLLDSRCIAMPTDSQATACSLSRRSPYASELEYVCLWASSRQPIRFICAWLIATRKLSVCLRTIFQFVKVNPAIRLDYKFYI